MGYPGDQEAEVMASAAQHLPTLDLVNGVSEALGNVIARVSLPAGDEPPSRLHALWFMAILCLRGIRAASWVVRAGYEDQALGYVRVVDELFNRAQKVWEDKSGEYARQWLADRGPGKPMKLTDKEFWDIASGPPHGTVRAIYDWLAISADDGSTRIMVGPELMPPRANATLAHLSYEAAAVGWRLSTEAELGGTNWAKLSAAIQSAMDEFVPDSGAGPAAG
jgi:hypothetical protein